MDLRKHYLDSLDVSRVSLCLSFSRRQGYRLTPQQPKRVERVKRIKLTGYGKEIGCSKDLAIDLTIDNRPKIKKEVIDLEKVELKDNSIYIDGTTNLDIAIKLEDGSMGIIAAEDVEQDGAALVEEVREEVQDLQIADGAGAQEQEGAGDKDLGMLGAKNQGQQNEEEAIPHLLVELSFRLPGSFDTDEEI